jgi:lipoprotein-releasing system permease protein
VSFSWFVALRYLLKGRTQTLLVLAAVTAGVSVVVFLSSLMSSLNVSLIEKTTGSQPHVTVKVADEITRSLVLASESKAIARSVQKAPQRLRSIDQWPALMRSLEHVRGITAVSPMVTGSGFAASGNIRKPIVVRGIEPERFNAILDLRSKLKTGRFDLSGTNVLIGKVLAVDLGVSIGDKIRIATPEGAEETLNVAGIFAIGNKSVDGAWVFASLRQAQSLYALPGGVTTLELKVADVFDAENAAAEIRDQTPLSVESWMKLNEDLLAALSAQEGSRLIIEFFVMLSVALGIASVLIVSVVQKSREIGILKAVGTPAHRILLIFVIQGGVLGFLGSILGSISGAGLARLFRTLALDLDGNPRFPIVVTLDIVVTASVVATAVGLFAAVIPARRASRLDPASAIRNG